MSNRISGTVDRVFFTSAKFSAGALVRDDGDRVRFRGPFCVSEGELVTLTGRVEKRSQVWTAVRCEERELRPAGNA